MKKIKHLFTIIFLAICFQTIAQNKIVANINEYNAAIKESKAGDVIVLKNGVWKDVKLNAFGNGTEENPIIVKAETSGEVIITGNSTLNIYGEYVIVSGLWFKDGATNYKSVVQFRKDSKTFANHCRFTNSTISYFETDGSVKNHWVDIWGKNNKVDHNNFTGKRSEGTTLVVWLKGDEHIENNHIIEYNVFGERPDLGKNGGETIRIGTSANSMKSSKTIVQKNIFAECNGEIEIISNKSGDNIFRDNLFIASQGTLTLRHGNNALVERNVFLGNGVKKTGGIRVINEGHIIRNNLLIGLEGDGYRGSIVLMNGVPNSPLNRYHQVKNVDIQNNTIINSGPVAFGEGKDKEKTLAPQNVNFANNLIYNTVATTNVVCKDDVTGINFKNNYIDAVSVDIKDFIATKVNWKQVKSLPVPTLDNPTLQVTTKNENSPNKDINGNLRDTFVAGAFNLDAKKLPKALSLRAGPGWKPNIIKPVVKAQDITVLPGEETLRKAISDAAPGSILRLKTGEYILEKTIKVAKNVTIIGDKDGATILSVKENLPKNFNYFFRVNEGVTLKISNVIMDGSVSSPKYAFVSPDKKESGVYNLYVDNVLMKNFSNKDGGAIFKAYEGTKADTLSFINSRFEDSFRGLNLSYDKKTMGAYNANVIIIENSVFKNIDEYAINFLRKIPSVDLPGGKLVINNSVFSNIYNQEKGKVLRVDGIHAVEISNTVFEDSYRIKTTVNLQGKSSFIVNSLIHDSGFIKASLGAKTDNLIYKNPKWEDDYLFVPSKKSPLLKENNGKVTIGLKNN